MLRAAARAGPFPPISICPPATSPIPIRLGCFKDEMCIANKCLQLLYYYSHHTRTTKIFWLSCEQLHAQAPAENPRRPGQAQTEYVGSQDHVSTEEEREQN